VISADREVGDPCPEWAVAIKAPQPLVLRHLGDDFIDAIARVSHRSHLPKMQEKKGEVNGRCP
jgi:hypothetical protein